MTLGEVDLTVLRRWLAEQSHAGRSRATIAWRAAAACAFSMWAHRQGNLARCWRCARFR